jgi:hypothetical protein
MQTNPQRINKIHKEVYGFEQPREFNDKDRRKLLRLLLNKKHNSKEKTLRSHRVGFFVPDPPSFPVFEDIEDMLFHNYGDN